MNLGIVILYVKDIQKSTTFYKDIVGLPLITEQSDAKFKMFNSGTSAPLALQEISTLPEGQAKPAGSVEVGFTVDNVDDTWARWKQCGVEMVNEPNDAP